jgi:hypothetical protein
MTLECGSVVVLHLNPEIVHRQSARVVLVVFALFIAKVHASHAHRLLGEAQGPSDLPQLA